MKPLEGITILEFSTMITAALASMMLAEQGARVVKVEPHDAGDPMRYIGARKGDISSLFAGCNRGKESLAIDLKSEAGLAFQIDSQRFLAAITASEQGRDIAFARADVAHGVARIVGLHLDDASTLLSQHHAGECRRDHRGEFENGDAFQRFHISALVWRRLARWSAASATTR